MFSYLLRFAVLLTSCCALTQAFRPTTTSSRTPSLLVRYAASPKPIDEAIAFYNEKFPFQREPPRSSPFVTLGMSDKMKEQMESRKGRRLTDIPEKKARSAFQELAKLYGDNVAKQMVIDLPVCLSFERSWFKPSLESYSEIFGKEEAKAMVARNPGLLAVKPSDAATVTDQTMTFSYLVAYTRPYSKVTLPLLFVLLSIPVVESITGISIRAPFFSLFPF